MEKHPTLAEELAWFRQHLDLRDYLLSKGYVPDRQRTTARYPAFSHPLTRDKVYLLKDRRYPVVGYYINQHDPSDKGTLIDFIRTREQKSLPEVRQLLRQFVPGSSPSHITNDKTEPQSAHQYVITKIMQEQKQANRDHYLTKERLIPTEIIQSPLFKGQVLRNDYKEERFIAFPFRDEQRDVIGIALKNQAITRMLGSRSGLWYSNHLDKQTKLDRIIITENPIDAMSYHLLHESKKQHPSILYVASGGNPSARQKEVLRFLIKEMEPNEIVLANDNDPAGKQFNQLYRKWFKDSGQKISTSTSQFKDWNADLYALALLSSKEGGQSSTKRLSFSKEKLLPKSLEKELWKKNYQALLSYESLPDAVVVKKFNSQAFAFSLGEIASINQDTKLKAVLEQVDRKTETLSSPRLTTVEEESQPIKDTSSAYEPENPGDKWQVPPAPYLSDKLNSHGTTLDDFENEQAIKQSFDKSIDILRGLIKDDSSYRNLLRKLDYYQHFPHLSEQQVEAYLTIEDRTLRHQPSFDITLGKGEERFFN